MIEYISTRVAVMYLGIIAELSGSADLYKNPLHPYTQALLSAVPVIDLDGRKERILLEGDVPSPINPAPGCRFAPRCAYRQQRCADESPGLSEIQPGHFVSCHFAGNLKRIGRS